MSRSRAITVIGQSLPEILTEDEME